MCLNWNRWKAGFLRVELDTEIRGLDIKKHGEPAYPTAAYGHGWDSEGDFKLSNLQNGDRIGDENPGYEDYEEYKEWIL